MQARMKHPPMIIPGAVEALQTFAKSAGQGGVPEKTLGLVHRRVSQSLALRNILDLWFNSVTKVDFGGPTTDPNVDRFKSQSESRKIGFPGRSEHALTSNGRCN